MIPARAGDIELNFVDQGSGIPLLLVHGFPLDHSMWRGQLEGLAAEYRLIAPDLRGFGRSQVTAGTVTMQQFADDLAGLLDQLKISEPVVFCGLSMGGYVAWQFWRRHAARLRALILCDTRAAADSEEVARGRLTTARSVLESGPAALADAMLPRLFAPQTAQEHPESIETTRKVILATSPEGIAAALRGMAERPDMTAQLPEIAVPTLCLCGAHDVISPPAEMQALARALRRAEYREIAHAGHMAPWEQPATVNDAIRAFVGSL